MSEILKLKKFRVNFCVAVEILAYRLPNKEFRIPIQSGLTLAGYAELLQLEPMEALDKLGFKPRGKILLIEDDEDGSIIRTLSIEDLNFLVLCAAVKLKSSHAAKFILATMNISVEDWCRVCLAEQKREEADQWIQETNLFEPSNPIDSQPCQTE